MIFADHFMDKIDHFLQLTKCGMKFSTNKAYALKKILIN